MKASGWRRFERSSDAYLAVTIALLILILLPILIVNDPRGESGMTAVLVGAAVTLTMAASQVSRWAVHASWLAALLVLFSAFFEGLTNGLAALGGIILAVMLLATPIVILRRVVKHKRVTATTIYGAIAAYLAFGLAFSLMYSAIVRLNPVAFANMTSSGLGSTNYFSFVTMTTLGYGDIVPVAQLARALAIFQTLLGQIYLVIVVARVVSLLGKPPRLSDST